MNRTLLDQVHDALESIKQTLHETFGPEVGSVATKAVDTAKAKVADLFAEDDKQAATPLPPVDPTSPES